MTTKSKKRWLRHEDEVLVALKREGKTWAQISEVLERSEASVVYRSESIRAGKTGYHGKPAVVTSKPGYPKRRACMCCGQSIVSTGPGHRLCNPCRRGEGESRNNSLARM
jgi:hypothetical protein